MLTIQIVHVAWRRKRTFTSSVNANSTSLNNTIIDRLPNPSSGSTLM